MKNAFYMEGNLWLYRLYLWVAILLWLPVSLPAVDLPNLTFRTITISDGLSNNIINTIYKDKRGFTWLGTQTGLDRFDGINVKSFLQFSGRTIFSIAETYNPQIQISAESETKRSIFREKDKTKRSKKESAQHSKSRNKSFVMTSVSAL